MAYVETIYRTLATRKIGTVLVEHGLINEDDIQAALEFQKEKGGKFGEVLVQMGKLTWEDLARVLQEKFDIQFVDLREAVIEPEAIALVPESIARKYTLMPIEMNGRTVSVAMAYPDDLYALSELRSISQKRVIIKLALPKEIKRAIDLYYHIGGEITQRMGQIAGINDTKVEDLINNSDDSPVSQTIQMIIQQGARSRASDVHFEPQANRLRVRFRVDGTLIDMFSIPLDAYPPLLTRLKIMADMDIAEQRRPQDGQFSLKTENREIDVRVATLNTSYGERVTLRLLDKSVSLYQLPELGFLPETEAAIEDILRSRAGMLLVAGPTGSGKTTTLYSCINHLDKNENNIITIEDPIEYTFHNINQTQVNAKAGITYASGLRAILRSDPDVVLIGEIRDQETAKTAIQAALTGHLLLASVHANDTTSTLFRLMELNIDAYLISSTLIGVLSQRMVRRICSYCKTEVEPNSEEISIYEEMMQEKAPVLYHGAGCQFCSHTGYLNRTGIFELMVMNESIRDAVRRHGNYDEMKELSVQRGMKTLLQDGMQKVKNGETSVTEVMRCLHSVGF